ncbi:hypothetical protein NUU61_007890 [Penicillium alfredii]|uniref:Uncharacterized protein n=1 Tax=Penicillium alfredii TaxID=1506179 RepID=A0A9W9ERB9_9EURO|nr:uncharacterized protein NUU61_007890 [Penicillium alfredii]KAJ5086583.1 hypothetical protein NUU61_007890 [Penicillium alfredii]
MDAQASMNNWLASTHAGDEQPLNNHRYPNWSSPGSSNQRSPGHREHAIQPPLLTTAFNGPQFQVLTAGPASTPLSSTSLSSPFTHGQSPCVPSSANARSAPSPAMASRHPSAYNVPYNPQDWGPMGGASARGSYQPSNMHRAVPQQSTHTDMSLSPPPPPYSPPSNRNRLSQESFGRNANYATPAPTPTHNSFREEGSEVSGEPQRRSMHRPRPSSLVYSNEPGSHQQSLPPPPPPPQGYPGSRSVSQSRIDAYQGPSYSSNPPPVRSQLSISASQYEQALPSPGFRGNDPMQQIGDLETPTRPPASRRAASAGAVVSSAGTSRSASQSRNLSPTNNWEPGMPLPPPPPGPPPTSRSLSASGSSESSSMRIPQGHGRGKARAPPALGTGLGSIPPTPADWVDEAYLNSRPSRDKEPLSIDTTKAAKLPDRTDHPDSNGSSQPSQRTPGSGGLFRSSAIRDPSAKGIRERRIERRNRQSLSYEDASVVSTSGNPWADALDQVRPSNLVLPEPNNSPDYTRQPTSSRITPRSTRSLGSDAPLTTSRSRASSAGLFSDQSSYSTPRPEPSPAGPSSTAFAHTPPFSPHGDTSPAYSKGVSQAVPPKALPTPPLNSGKDVRSRSRAASRGAEDRPISHLLHLPNDSDSMMQPLSPRRDPSQQRPPESNISQDSRFVQDAIQRHKTFIQREASAADEAESLQIFIEFIITESRFRRERYARVWESGSLELEAMHRKLFEMPPNGTATLPPSRQPTKPGPPLEIPQNRPSRPESGWWNNYQPCLSPIASMSMSNDEMSSRGRAPSRWWESKTGSSSEGAERKVQRSKRESKYMGLPREAMQWDQEVTPSRTDDKGLNYGHQPAPYGPDEYPPEKVGWHEESPVYSGAETGDHHLGRLRESHRLDVSRLITLPPPYPRHYPAVNNSHPDLVTYRTTVRSITDLSGIKSTRQRYKNDVDTMLQEHREQVQEGHRQFKSNIQNQIQEGSLTFAEAAEAEAAMIVEDNKRERDLAKRQLDTYQETVLKPMHAILTDRVSRATACIDELSSKLFNDAQHETPDQTQEEGDGKPELLETLTQLKWLFEAREQLHREMFDLISGRDEKYKTVALLPYQQNKNDDKLRETQAFFTQDALARRAQHETETCDRLDSFLDVLEQNVVRGVEVQLSAFWDIAPSLLALVQQVPENLRGFQVQIPADEYDENPSYHAHPLQYLYSLLSHAEKSSYQYIESQTNMLCLLHEVRSAVMRANRNLTEAQRIQHGEDEGQVHREMQATRADEELVLTTDLKDKVATVEGQWAEALGSQIQGLRERVKDQLLAEDGWEDLEQLEQ